jgi:hypothetical protein
VPTVQAQHETRDGQYLQLLRQGDLVRTSVQGTINDAHVTCSDLVRLGFISPEEMARRLTIVRADFDLAHARAYVHAAVTAYCPELS